MSTASQRLAELIIMRVVAIEEHHIIPEMSSYMNLSWEPPEV